MEFDILGADLFLTTSFELLLLLSLGFVEACRYIASILFRANRPSVGNNISKNWQQGLTILGEAMAQS